MNDINNRILIITSEFPPNVGGIGNHAYNLAKALSEVGYRITVLADIIDVGEDELRSFTEEQRFSIVWVKRKAFVVRTYLERILKALKGAGKADKVICSGKFALWVAIIIRTLYPKKELVAIAHGTELDLRSSMPKKLTSFALTKFNKIISVSSYTSRYLPAKLPSTTKRFIIHNGINCAEFEIIGQETLDGQPSLVTVGNVTPRKGQENVINALPHILSNYPSAKYHVIGKPTTKPKMESIAQGLKVDGAVHFYGAVMRQDLLQKLQGASIKLMLSNHTNEGDFEGFGIAVLEANAFGIPAIGSKASGIADAIEDSKTGKLVNQHDAAEVSNAVKEIMNNYSYFSENAKAWAKQHDWKIIVKQYVAALNA